jgi:septal ring factor EnvC (AmiA/AmiB activator)
MAEDASNGNAAINLIQQVAERIDQRFDEMDRRFGSVDSRLDRANDILASVQTQMGAITRWSDRFDREHTALIQTQAAQQKAIDELSARISKLERAS